MTRTARLYRIERLIRARGQVSFRQLIDELEVSPATLKRDLAYLRDRLGAPIEYDRLDNGYRLGASPRGGKHELPGLWFDERELYGLLMAHQLLGELDGQALLGRHLQPLRDRILDMLGASQPQASAVVDRVRIVAAARRPVPARWFEIVGEALVGRRRLRMRYLTRGRGEVGEREVSPQRLVHYRGTWYLDAWCHRAEGLRRFALDAIEDAERIDAPAREIAPARLAAAMDAGYGIYAGAKARWATLRFQPHAARWVGQEQWHPQQRARWLADGSLELRLPYADETELAMDILRYGPQVRVLAPARLAQRVALQHAEAAALYAASAATRHDGRVPDSARAEASGLTIAAADPPPARRSR
ncbi:MAG: WYL domain-containing protein [Burkholderiales bacterium]|nr:WYL domain-containing protein [Burkholderiales bacterium]